MDTESAGTSAARPDWESLVKGIRDKNGVAIEQFYQIFEISVRAQVSRRIWSVDDADDCVSEILVSALQGIQNGNLREPLRMAGYVQGVVRNVSRNVKVSRTVAWHAARAGTLESTAAEAESIEETIAFRERQQVCKQLLARLKPLHRCILRRFYLEGASPSEIQRELNLTPNQFRLAKSRAKAYIASALKVLPPGIRSPVGRRIRDHSARKPPEIM